MSGGKWEYIQYRLNDIIDDIKSEIKRSGKEKTAKELKEEWEGEIKEEDPRQMVFKYMKMMRSEFVKQ